MFRGNHPAKVDEKGRLKVPSAFKALLDAASDTQFFITSAEAKSMGLVSPTSSSADGFVGFSTLTGTGYSWNLAASTNGTNTAMVYGTDGGVVAANLRLLEDNRHVEPIYAPVPMVREAVLQQYPQIASLVKPLMESFTRESLQQLNERVQIDGESEEAVAEEYLRTQGFIG